MPWRIGESGLAQIFGIDIDALGRNAVPDSDHQVVLVLDNLNVR